MRAPKDLDATFDRWQERDGVEAVSRAIERWAHRMTMYDRLTLVRSVLCSVLAYGDSDEPIYTGVDPVRGPYEGPQLWVWALETLAYFQFGARRRRMSLATFEALAATAVRAGARKQEEHEAATDRYWAQRRREEEKP